MSSATIGALAPRLSGRWHWLAWLPVPLAVAAITTLWSADLRLVWPSPFLFNLVQYGSGFLGLVFIVIPAARGFLAKGQPSILMLGCGVLMSQIGAIASAPGFVRSLSTGFAIYNTSVLISALCHFTGIALTSRGPVRVRNPLGWLAAAYATAVAVMGLVYLAAMADRMPAFFTVGHGGTLLRTLVVSAAVVLFLLTAALLLRAYRRAASPFLFWYALGLILLATGLAGSMTIALQDSPLQWVTRFTQVVGFIYMCVAGLASAAQTGVWRIPGEFAMVDAGPQLDTLFRLSSDGIVVHEAISESSRGILLQANDAFCRLLGYPLEDILRLDVLDIFLPEEQAGALAARRTLPDAGVSMHLRTIIAHDGRRIPVEVSSREFEYRGRQLVMSIVRDVTERKRAEEALHESEERYRHLVKHAPAGIYDVDFTTGRFTEVNDAMCEVLGYTRQELLGMTAFDIMDDEAKELFASRIRQVQSGEQPAGPVEYRVKMKDGTLISALVNATFRWSNGRIVAATVVSHDITERKRAEEQVRRSMDELRATNNELARFNRAMVDRELTMITLKKEIDELCVRIGEPQRYAPEAGKKN